jgi:hypothetical protein
MDPICTCKPTKKSCAKCLKAARPAEALEEALLWLGEWIGKDFSKNRPLTLDSGRGVQAWIRLEDWKFADDKADVAAHRSGGPVCIGRTIARRVNGYWLKKLDEKLGVTHGCRIDTSVSDLPRVMRCPGSINVKTGRMSKFINVTDRVFVGLAQLLTVGTPTSAMSDPESPKDVVAGQSWQMVFPHLTMMAQVYLTQGQAEPGRHKVMWHTAKKFRELGVSRREASRALKWANRLQGEEEELPTDQITHALDTAYNG